MHQVKLFSTYECDRRYLEKSINDWLKANVDKTVVDFQIQPIFLGGSVKLYGYILYKDNNNGADNEDNQENQENEDNQRNQENQRNEDNERNVNQEKQENINQENQVNQDKQGEEFECT